MVDLIEHLSRCERVCAGCETQGQSLLKPLCDACLQLHLSYPDPNSEPAQFYSQQRAFLRAERYAEASQSSGFCPAESARIPVEVLVTPPLILTSDKKHPNEAFECYTELLRSEAV